VNETVTKQEQEEMANAVQYQQQGFFAQGQLIAVKWFRTREGMRAKLPFNKSNGRPAMQWFKPAADWAPRHNEITLARVIVDSERTMVVEFVPGDPAGLGQRVYEETQAALETSRKKNEDWKAEQASLEEAVQAAIEMATNDDAIDAYIRFSPGRYDRMWRTWTLKGETRPERILEIMREEARGKVK
jgi:hypothetical protein